MFDLSIIIVNWNVAALLAACLDSILRSAITLKPDDDAFIRVEIIVVDSASSDDSVTMLHQRYPQVTLIAESENVGYTRGNNIGLRAARGRHLLLLNPDTEVIGDALQEMVAYLDAHPDVGIVGPNTRNTDGSYQSTRRRFPTLTTAYFESTWLQRYAPKHILNTFYVNDAAEDTTLDVDWVQGSALMARREVYEHIGGLDEGYIMFCEELDWCHRAKDNGWRIVYVGDARIIHHGGKSTEQVAARKHIHFQQSKLRYVHKHHGAFEAQVLRLFLLASYTWEIAVEGVKALLGHKRLLRQVRIDAYRQVLRSGLKVT